MVEALKPEMARAKLRALHARLRAIYEEEARDRATKEDEEELGSILAGDGAGLGSSRGTEGSREQEAGKGQKSEGGSGEAGEVRGVYG